ncbi:MAG: hypothetical protein Q4G49_17505, partial [Paracoccus sp. (in: a-proteobacteria)]|nr:hypothetical protein [Paracoccus sp. (in: a-proteobacteria)]
MRVLIADHIPTAGRGPFTPSRIKGLPQTGLSLPAEAAGGLLTRALVTASHIPEGRALYPRPVPPALPEMGATPHPDPDPTLLPIEDRPLAQRPAPRLSGLRLLPLEGFIWGARTTPPQPRTRVDHVLIWVISGALQLDFPRRRLILGPGAVQFLPVGTAFATLPLGQARGHVLLIGRDLGRDLSPPLPDGPILGSIGDHAAALHLTLSDLAEESARGTPDAHAAVTCHLGLLSVRLSRLEPPPPRPAALIQAAPNLPLIEQFLKLAAAEL